MPDITLQINLSQGDIAYAYQTVPAIVEAHKNSVSEKLAVVDCCRPQKTQIINPGAKFPEPRFSDRVKAICQIAEDLKSRGCFDRIVYMRPGDEFQKEISQKYFCSVIGETHDCWGIALMAYIYGIEHSRSRFVIHYDADMQLYQDREYDWAAEAVRLLNRDEGAVGATPRISPPFSRELGLPDLPSLHEGEANIPIEGGWRNGWFSTRCLLLDKEKFFRYLPLLKGPFFAETLLRKLLQKSYPPALEMMMYRRIGRSGGFRINLSSEKAWLLHPAQKTEKFMNLFSKIQKSIHSGIVPLEQKGYADIKVEAWERFLTA